MLDGQTDGAVRDTRRDLAVEGMGFGMESLNLQLLGLFSQD